jgi:polyisoprenoid-binding protein YceI
MKKLLIIIGLLSVSPLFAQKYMTRTAEVYFLSDKDAVEIVEATNNQVGAVIDLENGAIAFQIQMRAFHFDIALMEEHFNENYVESELYPKATFRGSFIDLPKDLSTAQTVAVVGVMEFHGVKKEMEIEVLLSLTESVLNGDAKFDLLCSDFDINIPKIVADKLANTIQVTVKSGLTKL